ncbi:MAG: TIR domain-containing protein, partial [Anaerolineae bacterium]|nr:TIR domain-containing protein [Anaerolineae bacterium]
MPDVFISYSRKDTDFARRLVDALQQSGRDSWVDWAGIPYSAEWWREICQGINSADNFVFIISPDSLKSEICNREVEYARHNHKRIIPIMHRPAEDKELAVAWFEQEWEKTARENWTELKRINWLFFRETDDFDDAFAKLTVTAGQDPEHVRQHTRLLIRAAEWEANNRKPAYALRADDLRQAEIWLAAAPGKDPSPTDLHRDYIEASRIVQAADEKRVRNLNQARFGLVLAVALVALLGFVFINLRTNEQTAANQSLATQVHIAQNNVATAQAAQATSERQVAEAQSIAWAQAAQGIYDRGDPFQSLALVLEANKIPNQPFFAQSVLADIGYYFGARRHFEGHTGSVGSVAFSPDGRFALSGSSDNTLILWNVASGEIIRRFEGHSGSVYSVAFSPDGRFALSGSADNSLVLWDVASGVLIHRFEEHTSWVNSVTFSPDGRFALSGSSDNTLILWNVASGALIRRFEGHTNWVNSIAFSPDGRTVLSGSGDHTLILWDVASGALIRCFEGHTSWVNSVAFSPDGRFALSGSSDSTLILWDVASGALIRRFEGHTGRVNSIAFSPDGRTVLSGSFGPFGRNPELILWDVASGESIRRFEGHIDSVNSVAFSPDGRTVLFGSGDSTLILWDVASGALIRRFEGHTSEVNSIAFSPDGRTALSGSGDSFGRNPELIPWDVVSGESIRHFEGSTGRVKSIAFSPDGRTALSGSGDPFGRNPELILWDVVSGESIRRFEGHTSAVNSIAFSPDGRTVLSGSSDSTLILWDVVSGESIRRFEGHTSAVSSIAFSPDGRTVLSGSSDSTLILWRLDTLDELIQWTHDNRQVDKLTCANRLLYNVRPLCEENANIEFVLTPFPTSTIPIWTPIASPTASNTPTSSSTPTVTPTIPAFTPILAGTAQIGDNDGEIQTGEAQIWTYQGTIGEIVTIRVNADKPANRSTSAQRLEQGLLDTYFILRAPDGSTLIEVDDIDPAIVTDSLLENFTLPENGIYEIEVRGWDNSTGGEYTLIIESVPV